MKANAFILLIVILVLRAAGAPSDFNAVPGYGTDYDNDAGELIPQNITLTSETTENDGRKRLSFTGEVRNASIGYFESVRLRLEPPGAGWSITIVQESASVPDLPPGGTGTTQQSFTLLAAAADAEAVKSQLLAGQRLLVTARELHQFRLPVVAIDAASEQLFTGTGIAIPGEVVLNFSSTSSALNALTPGKLFLENPRAHTLNRGTGPNLPQLARFISSDEVYETWQTGKIRTTRMLEVLEKSSIPGGGVSIRAKTFGGDPIQSGPFRNGPAYRGLMDNLKTGSFAADIESAFDPTGNASDSRNPYEPPLGNSAFSASEDAARAAEYLLALANGPRDGRLRDLGGLFTLHLPVNDIELAPGVKLDGQITLTALDVKLGVRFRNFALQRFNAVVSNKGELNLRFTVNRGADNRQSTLFEKEKTIAKVPLPKIYIPLGNVPIELAPIFTAKVGAELRATTSVTLPLTGSIESGVKMSWDASRPEGSRFDYVPFHNTEPLGISKPRILKSVGMSASIYAEAGVEVLLDEVAGPFVSARATATFDVHPFQNPWWNLDGRLDFRSGLRMRILGFEIDDYLERLIEGPALFTNNAGTALPSGAGTNTDPAEGSDVRWGQGFTFNNGTIATKVLAAKVNDGTDDVFLAVPNVTNETPVMRVGKKGNIVFAVSPSGVGLGNQPTALAAVPGGGFVLAGNNFISRHNTGGGTVWTANFDLKGSGGSVQNE